MLTEFDKIEARLRALELIVLMTYEAGSFPDDQLPHIEEGLVNRYIGRGVSSDQALELAREVVRNIHLLTAKGR